MDHKQAAIKRAIEILTVAEEFIINNHLEDISIVYDGVECDGQCLSEDCIGAAEELGRLIPKDAI